MTTPIIMETNIPRSVEDPHYRYRMPVLIAKIEGRQNGVKTLVENLAQVAEALARPPLHLLKYFGSELGAMTIGTEGSSRFIVNGKHDAEDLAKVLDRFIDKYVLCGECGNPETALIVKSETIYLHCEACGLFTRVEDTGKFSSYIIKSAPSEKTESTKEGKVHHRGKHQKEEVDEDDWAVETSPDAVNKRRLELLGLRKSSGENASGMANQMLLEDDEKDVEVRESEAKKGSQLVELVEPGTNPLPALEKFWEKQPSPEDAFKQVTALAVANNWTEMNLIKIIFGSLFLADIRKNFVIRAKYMRLFVTSKKHQKIILGCVEKLCERDAKTMAMLNDILAGLWEEGLIDEEVILKWHKQTPKDMPHNLAAKIKSGSLVFVDWLKTNDDATI